MYFQVAVEIYIYIYMSSHHLWYIPIYTRSQQNLCSLVLYGHTARVWDGRLLPDCVISIGEDATCRVWGYGGECIQVVEGHRGRSIWSMAVDESSGLVVREHNLVSGRPVVYIMNGIGNWRRGLQY